jgi:hypothetical protein
MDQAQTPMVRDRSVLDSDSGPRKQERGEPSRIAALERAAELCNGADSHLRCVPGSAGHLLRMPAAHYNVGLSPSGAAVVAT